MYAQNKKQQSTKANPYLVQKVMSASPEQLISYIYDFGVTSCAKNDSAGARKAINVLIQSLNFDYEETSNSFFAVYRHLNKLINERKFDEAKAIFNELKQTWSTAFKVH